jgi:hypothetical protein
MYSWPAGSTNISSRHLRMMHGGTPLGSGFSVHLTVWLSSTSTRLRFVSSATPSTGPCTGSRGPTALRIPTILLVP